MAKINQYPAKTVPSNNDEFVLHDTASGSTKKITRGDLIGGAPLPADSVDEQAIDLATLNFGNYTTSEVDTGFKWIDGKAIYKKTINLGSLPNNSRKDINHNISSIGVIISLYGAAQMAGASEVFTLPHASTATSASQISLLASNTQVSVITGTNRTGYSGYVTMLYTKV